MLFPGPWSSEACPAHSYLGSPPGPESILTLALSSTQLQRPIPLLCYSAPQLQSVTSQGISQALRPPKCWAIRRLAWPVSLLSETQAILSNV